MSCWFPWRRFMLTAWAEGKFWRVANERKSFDRIERRAGGGRAGLARKQQGHRSERGGAEGAGKSQRAGQQKIKVDVGRSGGRGTQDGYGRYERDQSDGVVSKGDRGPRAAQ